MISQILIDQVKAHANSSPSREICGVIVSHRRRNQYVPCNNIAENNSHFVIDPIDYAAAEDAGTVIAIVHSHVNVNPAPSQADLIGIERTQLPWLIVNTPVNNYTYTEPSGYLAPYVGREFVHGITDCYSIWRDYYKRELGIEMIDYERSVEWWLKGRDLYEDNYRAAGFLEVDIKDLKKHDIILMKVASPVQNHAAVYLGDNIILQHVMGKISSKDVYGGWWRKITTKILRHESQL
jgi:proteasome lid subunit RPN8/RPN11